MIYWRDHNFKFMDEYTIYSLDTEVSSFFVSRESGKVIAYDPAISSDDYNENYLSGAVVYIWMIGINDTVIYGRELDELPEALELLRSHSTGIPVIYIHNAAYDFQFLRNVLHITDVFARTVRKPMKFSANDCEFRCSYMLTRLSLDSWGKYQNLKVKKQKGLLNYDVLRSPLTPLSEDELKYCEYDILVMYEGIKKYLERYEEFKKIPVTQTGEVRAVVRDLFKNNNRYLWKITGLQPYTVNEYKQLKAVFAGGETHGNRWNVGRIHEKVGSFDKTSDYPYQMLAEKYPMSRFAATTKDLRFMQPNKFAYIIELTYHNIKVKTPSTYINRSHCIAVRGGKFDNGRIVEAEMIAICITEQDYQTISEMYDYDPIDYERDVILVKRSRKQYLPKSMILYILALYKNKTELKGVDEEYDLYCRSKEFINSMFGMCCTDICLPDVYYHENQWNPEEYVKEMHKDLKDGHMKTSEELLQEKLDDIQKKFYRNFLAYQWGVWITAYARRELMRAINHCGMDEIYHDTDSVKCINSDKYLDYFDAEDAVMDEKLRKMCDFYEIDFDLTRPRREKGKGERAPLGHWEHEGIYDKFITLGAKKYAYENLREPDGVSIKDKNRGIHVTVSGVPKEQGSKLLGSLENFKKGFIFDREKCGRKLLTYLDGCNPEVTLPDGYKVHHPFGINMRNNSYKLGISSDLEILIKELNEQKGFL